MRNLADAKFAFAVIEHHVMFHRDYAKPRVNGSVSTGGGYNSPGVFYLPRLDL